MEETLDLSSLTFQQLKATAKANNIEVGGTMKQPFIDAIAAYAEENELVIPEGLLDPPAEKAVPSGKLPAGSFHYQQMRKVEDEWKKEKVVILTEEHANILNAQTATSKKKYVRND